MARKLILIVIVVALLVPVLFLFIEHERGKRALAAIHADLRARGEELDINALAPKPMPMSSNGLGRLRGAASRLDAPDRLVPPAFVMVGAARAVPGSSLDTWSFGRTQRNWEMTRDWLTERQEDLALLRESLEAPSRQAVLDYSQGFSTLVPHLADMKKAVMVLDVAAAWAAHQGDFEGALEALRDMDRIAGDLSQDPLLISQVVRVACANLATWRAWDVMHAGEWSEAQYAQLQTVLPPAHLASGMARSLEGERAMVIVGIARSSPQDLWDLLWGDSGQGGNTSSGWIMLDSTGTFSAQMWRFAWGDQSMAHYLTSMQRVIDRAREAVQRNSGELTADTAPEPFFMERGIGRMRTAYARALLPALANASLKAFRSDTQREMLCTAIALRRHHLRHGRYPDNLGALVPEFLEQEPIDYMDGQRLRYLREGDESFRLWSVGDDFRDDGGDPTSTRPNQTQNWWWAIDAVWPGRGSPQAAELPKGYTVRAEVEGD